MRQKMRQRNETENRDREQRQRTETENRDRETNSYLYSCSYFLASRLAIICIAKPWVQEAFHSLLTAKPLNNMLVITNTYSINASVSEVPAIFIHVAGALLPQTAPNAFLVFYLNSDTNLVHMRTVSTRVRILERGRVDAQQQVNFANLCLAMPSPNGQPTALARCNAWVSNALQAAVVNGFMEPV